MQRFLQTLRYTFINIKFLLFCLLGCLNTFNTAFFSWLGHLILQENIAAVFGYAVSLSIAYLLNCFFVFRIKPRPLSYLRFILSYAPSFIIYFLLTFLTINTLDIPQFWATVVAVAAGGPTTFFIIRLFAFGQSDADGSYS